VFRALRSLHRFYELREVNPLRSQAKDYSVTIGGKAIRRNLKAARRGPRKLFGEHNRIVIRPVSKPLLRAVREQPGATQAGLRRPAAARGMAP
jgi:hypothetical protein